MTGETGRGLPWLLFPVPPARAPVPSTIAATAAAARTGARAVPQRRRRSLLRPRLRARPMSTADGGAGVALTRSSNARAPASSMAGPPFRYDRRAWAIRAGPGRVLRTAGILQGPAQAG